KVKRKALNADGGMRSVDAHGEVIVSNTSQRSNERHQMGLRPTLPTPPPPCHPGLASDLRVDGTIMGRFASLCPRPKIYPSVHTYESIRSQGWSFAKFQVDLSEMRMKNQVSQIACCLIFLLNFPYTDVNLPILTVMNHQSAGLC
ncbi:unnamed protein product, partial [Allacma fusca]